MHTLADTVIVFCSRCSRVTLPLTVEEVRESTGGKARPFAENNFHISPLSALQYQVAQLFSVAEASKENTGGGEGIEVLKNEPFTDFPLLGKSFTICN